MDCHDVADLLPDYLQHSLKAAHASLVDEHLRACADCRDTVELWQRLQSVPAARPSERLRARFEEMLAAYREGVASQPARLSSFTRLAGSRWLQAVAAIAIIAVAFTAGMFVERVGAIRRDLAAMQQELAATRQMVAISLLENQSASDRLAGVNWTARLPQANPEILEALLDRLRGDDSVDVRLAALDALRRFAGETSVRRAILGSLAHQESPLVQIGVVDFLVECGARDAVPQLQRFERDTDLLPEVRQKVEWGINRLNRG